MQIFFSLERTTVLVGRYLGLIKQNFGRTSPKKGWILYRLKQRRDILSQCCFVTLRSSQHKVRFTQGRYLFFVTFKIIYDKKIFTQVGFCRTLANLVGQCPMTDCYLQPCFVIKPPDSTYCVHGSTQKSLIFFISYSKTVFCLTCLMPE